MSGTTPDGNPNMDYDAHNSTYAKFLQITKVGIILLVLLLAAMKYFLIA